MKGLVIAGTHSGAGKTSITLAMMAALKRRGYAVQGFKVGPDFIDPGHHTMVTGRPSHNLDGWMLSKEENLTIFSRYAGQAEAVVVEGVMGLYDGYDGLTEAGSTAQMAKWLGLPVLLTVDARSVARSLAATALGFARFDTDLTWAGLAANRVGSPNHIRLLAEAMTAVPDMKFWGGLARESAISLPERHLGLVTADETPWGESELEPLADWIEAGIDVAGLWDSLPEINPKEQPSASIQISGARVRIGVARDRAFCFYYPENLSRLEAAGAEVVFFSPVQDRRLPRELDGLYIGGGYPELYARELADNHDLREAIQRFGTSGKPVYAECGGLMYISRSLKDDSGRVWPMAGLLPIETRMLTRLKSLGYRELTLTEDTPLGPAGLTARGHEFHYSEITEAGPTHQVYQVRARGGEMKDCAGFMKGNVLASYVHLHFGSNPEVAENLTAACRNRR